MQRLTLAAAAGSWSLILLKSPPQPWVWRDLAVEVTYTAEVTSTALGLERPGCHCRDHQCSWSPQYPRVVSLQLLQESKTNSLLSSYFNPLAEPKWKPADKGVWEVHFSNSSLLCWREEQRKANTNSFNRKVMAEPGSSKPPKGLK